DVQPGVVYAALNRRLRPHGLFFPPSPGGSADVATVGGMVANNASGIYSVKYGGTRDHVRAATVVTGAGDVLRLGHRGRKSAAGGEPIVLAAGRDAWSIREHATRAIGALRPDAATVRVDVAIPIGALPTLVARAEAIAAERGLAAHLFGHVGIGILHALVLAD